MEHWKGIVQVASCRVGASLCYSSTNSQLAVPPRNAILFMGDRVEGTGNPVIEKLSDLENVASILESKLGWAVNAWVLEAPSFVGPFAVYKGFLPSITSTGEPKAYEPDGFPAASNTTSILANCLQQFYDAGSRIVRGNGDSQKEAANDMIKVLEVFESRLREMGKRYFGGEEFGFVDVAFIPFSSWFHTYQHVGQFEIGLEENFPCMDKWVKRCMERENVKKVLPPPPKVLDYILHLRKKLGID